MKRAALAGLTILLILATALLIQARRDSSGKAETSPPSVLAPDQVTITLPEILGPEIRLRTTEAVLPGGWAAAMSPVVVDWTVDPSSPPGAFRIRNLNHGGNPVEGTTIFRSALVFPEGIDHAEFIIVPLDRLGQKGLVAHAMIRFVFTEEHPLILLDASEVPERGDAKVRDLIMSWEAWRAPGQQFEILAGLDPRTFGLSLRAYTGPQRFLEDGLQRRDWFSHPLDFHDEGETAKALLRLMLTLGDGIGRRSLSRIFPDAHDSGAPDRSAGGADDRWPVLELTEQENSYQTIQRSCATMALYCVDLAVSGGDGHGSGTDLSLGSLIGPVEPWMGKIAHGKPAEVLRHAPSIVAYIVRHPQVVPTLIPGILDRKGLLRRDGDHSVTIHYSLSHQTPYGEIKQNLIR